MDNSRVYTITRYEYGPGLVVRAELGTQAAALVVTGECKIWDAIKKVDHILGDHIRCAESQSQPLTYTQ